MTPEDACFLGSLASNPFFLSSLLADNCLTSTIQIQSPLDTSQLSQVCRFLSYIPTLKTLFIHSRNRLSLS